MEWPSDIAFLEPEQAQAVRDEVFCSFLREALRARLMAAAVKAQIPLSPRESEEQPKVVEEYLATYRNAIVAARAVVETYEELMRGPPSL